MSGAEDEGAAQPTEHMTGRDENTVTEHQSNQSSTA